MSFSKLGRSWRGRVPFAVVVVLMTGALIAAPQVSQAKNAVKQFLASISKVNDNTYTETVTNCGDATGAPCTAASTIGLGTVYITVPASFNITSVTSPVTSPNGHTWVASFDSASSTIKAFASTGSDKLQAGEMITFTFTTALNTCPLGTSTFTTRAWGSNTASSTDPFTIQSPQPVLVVTHCPGTNGTDVTGSGFGGVVNVTFNGVDIGPTCTNLSAQWGQYHLPDIVNFDGSGATGSPKRFTFTFPGTSGIDSSWYLVCIASTISWPGGTLTNIGGTNYYVGILSSCYIPASNSVVSQTPPTPCITQQYATLPAQDGSYSIVISVLDPLDTKFH
jgi:hypothetical protein